MNENLDRIMSSEENIQPSSGFVSTVMDSIHPEATTPAPIPFPWKHAMPGLVACIALVIALVVDFAASFGHINEKASTLLASDRGIAISKQMFEGSGLLAGSGWILVVLVLLLSVATMQLSMRIAGGRN